MKVLLFCVEYENFRETFYKTNIMINRLTLSKSADKLPKLVQVFMNIEKNISQIWMMYKIWPTSLSKRKLCKLSAYKFITDSCDDCKAFCDREIFSYLPMVSRGTAQKFDYNNITVIINSFARQLFYYIIFFEENMTSLKDKVLISNVNYPFMLAVKIYDELILQEELLSKFDSATLKNILNGGVSSRVMGENFTKLRADFFVN